MLARHQKNRQKRTEAVLDVGEEEVEPVERPSIAGNDSRAAAFNAGPIDRNLVMARGHHFLPFLCIKGSAARE
jgi:hypothetical protein